MRRHRARLEESPDKAVHNNDFALHAEYKPRALMFLEE